VNTEHRLENVTEYTAAALRMLERYKKRPGEGQLLYSAADQLAQAARELNRMIGYVEGVRDGKSS
jgi:hypothetical protein